MATTIKAQYAGLDFQKVGIIKDFLANPLSTSDRTTLGGTLGSSHAGLPVYDTDESILYIWDGTQWAVNPVVQSGLTPKGTVAFNDTEPVSPTIGDLYVFNSAGSNTWEGTTVVQVGDQVWWDGTAWQFIQVNVAAASETVPGYIEIATQAETNTGTDDVRAITPLKLATNLSALKVAKVYFSAGVSLVADTPLTVTHSLNLQNRNAFTWNFMTSNSNADVDCDSIGVNSLSLTSNVNVTGDITIIGF